MYIPALPWNCVRDQALSLAEEPPRAALWYIPGDRRETYAGDRPEKRVHVNYQRMRRRVDG